MNKNNIKIIDLSSLSIFIKLNIYNLLKITSFFLLTALIYIFLTDTYYESRITLYPAGELYETFNLFEQYENITDAFGFETSKESNYYLPDIIVSNSLKRKIVQLEWNNEKNNKPVNLIQYWKIDEESILDSFTNLFESQFYNKEVDRINKAIKKIDKLIDVDEKNSGLVEVSVLMQEPQMAADIANYISNYVVSFVSNQQKSFATKNKLFIENRLLLSKEELLLSENILTDFRNKNPQSLDTPDLQLKRLQLLRDVEVNQEVFITLRNQYEIAKLEESKERLFINILDPAYISIDKAHPKIIIIIIISLLIGFIISILSLLMYYNIKFKNES